MMTTRGNIVRMPTPPNLYSQLDAIGTLISLTFSQQPVTKKNWPSKKIWEGYFTLRDKIEQALKEN
jgi:hypothetical protein